MEAICKRQIDSPEFRKVDEEARTVEFVASSNAVDSYRTVLPVDKWDLTRFQRNGVIGYQHDLYESDDPDNVIGKGEAFVEDDQLIVRITFEPADINEKADKIFRKIQFGSIKAVSVGFSATAPGHWGDKRNGEQEDVYYFEGQELLEVSVVNIPSNAEAVKRSMEEERKGYSPKVVEEPEIGVQEDTIAAEARAKAEVNICLTLAKAAQQLAKKSI